MTYADQLAALGAQLGPIGAGADQAIATLDAENATLNTELTAANAQIATLQSELAAATTPPPSPAPVPTPPPATGTVFVDNDFSGGGGLAQVVAPLGVDSTGVIAPYPDGSAAKCVQFSSPIAGATKYLTYKFGNNAALLAHHPNGIFARFDFGYDAAALTNADRAGQFKHWLSRYLDWNSTAGAVNTSGPGGLMGGVGAAFYGEGGAVPNQLVVIDDANTGTIPQSATGIILQPNVMQRVQYWCSRDPVAQMGHCKMWAWNGTSYDLKVDFSSPNMFRDTDGPYDHLWLMLGDDYSNVAGTAYLGRVKIADFFIAD